MARPPLSERRKAHTRREIAESALQLFARDGYDRVTVEAIAEEAGASLRTFYRYFPSKDEVLSPIIVEGTEELAGLIAGRPARERLPIAVQRAYEAMNPRAGPHGAQMLIRLLVDVPALRSRWLNALRLLEDTLVPIIQQRSRRSLTKEHAQLTAAAIVSALRIALERAAKDGANEDPLESVADMLGRSLRYFSEGAGL